MNLLCSNDNRKSPPTGANVVTFPAPTPANDHMPNFSWSELEQVLVQLAASVEQAEMSRHLVSAAKKHAAQMSSYELLRDVLVFSSVILDRGYSADS